MRIAITGSHGFIASYLIDSFRKLNYEIIPIERQLLEAANNANLSKALESCDVVINLAGATINQRWTEKAKKEIHDSRIFSTRALVSTINNLQNKPKLLISCSAVGAYKDNAWCDEGNTHYGDSFLSLICKKWESEAKKISPEVRLALPRLGVVLAKDGGAFPMMKLPFRYFVGGKIGSGEQGFSWIHIDDVVAAFHFIIQNESLKGVINITSPDRINNQIFTDVLSGTMKRPALFTVPISALKLLLGEQSQLITQGQSIYPGKLFRSGYNFHFPTIESAICNLIIDKKD